MGFTPTGRVVVVGSDRRIYGTRRGCRSAAVDLTKSTIEALLIGRGGSLPKEWFQPRNVHTAPFAKPKSAARPG